MANVIPYAFRGELFTGTHNFASGGDSFKLALYTSNPYNTSSTVYVVTNEVSSSGTNYTAAGNALTGNAVVYATAVASCDCRSTTLPGMHKVLRLPFFISYFICFHNLMVVLR